MDFKIGDTVWYIDNTPQIRKDIIKHIFENPKRYTLEYAGSYFYTYQFKLFPTKEALLAAIDPPAHNFAVGQTVWYVEDSDGEDVLRVDKHIITDVTRNGIRVTGKGIICFDLEGRDLGFVFDNPQDAVTKALELKQWI